MSSRGIPAKRPRLSIEPYSEPPIYSIEDEGEEYQIVPATPSEKFEKFAKFIENESATKEDSKQPAWLSTMRSLKAASKEIEQLLLVIDNTVSNRGFSLEKTTVDEAPKIQTKDLAVSFLSKNDQLKNGYRRLLEKSSDLKAKFEADKAFIKTQLRLRKSWRLAHSSIDFSYKTAGSVFLEDAKRGSLPLTAIESNSYTKTARIPLIMSLNPNLNDQSASLNEPWEQINQDLLSKQRSLFREELYSQLCAEKHAVRLAQLQDGEIQVRLYNDTLIIRNDLRMEVISSKQERLQITPLIETMAIMCLRAKHRAKELNEPPLNPNILQIMLNLYQHSLVRDRVVKLLEFLSQKIPNLRFHYRINGTYSLMSVFILYFENLICTQVIVNKKDIYIGLGKTSVESESELLQCILGKICDKILEQLSHVTFALQCQWFKNQFQITTVREKSTLTISVVPGNNVIMTEARATQHPFNGTVAPQTAVIDWRSCWGTTLLEKLRTLITTHAAAGLDPPDS